MPAGGDFNPESLVEEGLQLYGRGELDAALARWRVVLEREPENYRAREYLKYVEDNRAALEESFRLARAQAPVNPTPEATAPLAEPVQELSAELPSQSDAWARRRPADADTNEGLRARGKALPATPGEDTAEGLKARQATPAAPGGPLGAVPTSETLTDEDIAVEVDEEEGSAPKPPPLPQALEVEADPSFLELADEISRTAQRISEEIQARPSVDVDLNEDHTPRFDLGELKSKVAESRRRRAAPPPAPGPPRASRPERPEESAQPFDAPTAPVLIQKTPPGRGSTLLGPPPDLDDPSISRRPTPSGLTSTTAAEGRAQRLTPLSLIEGGAGRVQQDFEPLEATPVAQRIPRPARLVPLLDQGGTAEVPERSPGPGERGTSSTPAKLTPTSKPFPRPEGLAQASRGEGQEVKGATCIGLGPGQPQPDDTIPSGGPDPFSERRSLTPTRDSAEKLESLLASARQLHEQGTFEGSLWLCERVLSMEASSHEAQELLEKNQTVLLRQYREQLGDLGAVPVVQIPQHEIMWHKLDHRAGFLLSRIDGQLSFEDLLDVSGMSEFEACRILSQLMSQGVIGPRR